MFGALSPLSFFFLFQCEEWRERERIIIAWSVVAFMEV